MFGLFGDIVFVFSTFRIVMARFARVVFRVFCFSTFRVFWAFRTYRCFSGLFCALSTFLRFRMLSARFELSGFSAFHVLLSYSNGQVRLSFSTYRVSLRFSMFSGFHTKAPSQATCRGRA